MKDEQSQQTLDYFNKSAKNWKVKSISDSDTKVNVVKQRNGYVEHIIGEKSSTKKVLDIGCGTGDLVCQIAKNGIFATGVDFAEEMIHIANEKKNKEKIENADFVCGSIFDFDFDSNYYDVISANGFIEYVSTNEMIDLFEIIFKSLKNDGSFVFGSRNRLFNIFCLNNFTRNELDGSSVHELLDESLKIVSTPDLNSLIDMKHVDLQEPDIKHESTGIEVSKRFQYTPVQLCNILHKIGFVLMDIYPIHIHAVPPAFKDNHPDIHASISNMLQSYYDENRVFLPYASSFMIHAKK